MVIRKTEHGLYAYTALGCRCYVCKKAMARKNAARPQCATTYISVQPLIDRFGDTFVKRNPRNIPKWLKIGISHRAADRICVEYGYHPYEVYGDLWFYDIWEEMRKDKECANADPKNTAHGALVKTAPHT